MKCLSENVPDEVPGIAFLSGGQTSEEATAHLSSMNEMGPHPWQLTFSYGRALQAEPLKVWSGVDGNIEAAQEAFIKRSRLIVWPEQEITILKWKKHKFLRSMIKYSFAPSIHFNAECQLC